MSDLVQRVGSELHKRNSGVRLMTPYCEKQIRLKRLTSIEIGVLL